MNRKNTKTVGKHREVVEKVEKTLYKCTVTTDACRRMVSQDTGPKFTKFME